MPQFSSSSTAMHRALCCPWMLSALQADISGVVSEEMEQNTPFSIACNLGSSAGEDGVPSDTPHPSSLHCLGVGPAAPPQCKGRAYLGVLTVFQDENPSVSIVLVLALPRAPQDWEGASSCSRVLTRLPQGAVLLSALVTALTAL